MISGVVEIFFHPRYTDNDTNGYSAHERLEVTALSLHERSTIHDETQAERAEVGNFLSLSRLF